MNRLFSLCSVNPLISIPRFRAPLPLLSSNSLSSLFHSSSVLRCGYVGVFDPRSTLHPTDLRYKTQSALKSLHHRGPDGNSLWISEPSHSSVPSKQTVSLGHTRLAIIDLSADGNQPMHCVNDEDDMHLVVNGEIYDYERIRAQGMKDGFRFQSKSDSEVLFYLYKKHGVDFVDHLRGEFSFLLFDRKRSLFIAGRDRFGIKPLYYFFDRENSRYYFASEIKALLAAGVPSELNVSSLVTHSFNLEGGTIFKGIQAFPPGHILVLNPNNESRKESWIRYWDFQYVRREDEEKDTRTPQALIKELRERFIEAVELRLKADVDVGVYLSGGLDSCSTLGVASHLRGGNVDSYTISFGDDERFNEAALAKEQAALSKSRHHIISITQDLLADNFENSVYHVEQPMLNLNGTAKFLLSKFVRDHGKKVVITGEGADEIFGGYLPFRFDYAEHDLKGITAEQRKLYMSEMTKTNVFMGEKDDKSKIKMKNTLDSLKKMLGFQPRILSDLPFLPFLGLLTPELQEKYAHLDPFQSALLSPLFSPEIRKLSREHKISRLNASLYVESKTILHNICLTFLGDRNEMAHSIEGRLPFLDHTLVEFVCSLPNHMKIHKEDTANSKSNMRLVEKYILKEAMKPFITPNIYNRMKHPFIAPPASTNKEGKLYDYIQSTIRGKGMKDLYANGIFSKSKIESESNKLDALASDSEGIKGSFEKAQVALETEGSLLNVCSVAALCNRYNMQLKHE